MATTGGIAPSLPSPRSSSASSTRRCPTSRAALAAYPKSAHGAHIRGHLFYEMGQREEGLAFLTDWMKDYPREGLMHVHNNWHLALWSMETGRHADAWRIYDDGAAAQRRLGTAGQRRDRRAGVPAARRDGGPAAPRRALAGAGRLRDEMVRQAGPELRRHAHGAGLRHGGRFAKLAGFMDNPRGAAGDMVPPMARGFDAFARGDWKTAEAELEPLLDTHERLGGSRAQRDLLEYSVAAAKLRGGKKEEARAFVEKRRPANAKTGELPAGGASGGRPSTSRTPRPAIRRSVCASRSRTRSSPA